jgi:hypothetical protein
MAELKKNGLWNDIATAGTNVTDRVLGPSADYVSMIRTPAQQGVGQNGDIGQLVTNAGAVGEYTKDLITGNTQPIGNAQFVETGGMCKTPNGEVVPRWSYVNNRSTGAGVMPETIRRAIGNDLNGIIPGMFGDLANLNPLTMLNGLYLDGVPDCEATTCPVTNADGSGQRNETKFVTYGLEQNLDGCTVEGFGGQFTPFAQPTGPARMVPIPDSTPLLLWGSAVLLILYLVVK